MPHKTSWMLAALLATATAACSGSGAADSAGSDAVPVWEIGSTPELEIGEVDGAPEYLLHRLASSVALPGNRVALLNAGSHEIRIYDDAGTLVARSGRQGAGPGEFRRPSRIHLAADTLVVLDDGAGRLSLHDLDGAFLSTRELPPQAGRMLWDEWLHDRSWVDGPSLGMGRDAVIEALARLPAPDSTEGYRHVHATDFGHLWVRQPAAVGSQAPEWHIHDLEGAIVGRITLPGSFEIQRIGPDYLLGRSTDSLGVEVFQRYALDAKGTVREPRALTLGTLSGNDSRPAPPGEADLRGTLRMLAGAQEMYYADPASGYRYADDHRKLVDFAPPENVDVRIVSASRSGYRAVAMHRETGAMCGVGVGAVPPAGWASGAAMCQ